MGVIEDASVVSKIQVALDACTVQAIENGVAVGSVLKASEGIWSQHAATVVLVVRRPM
eukprot:m.184303 g.184303  ORF g.184303 m.184303 type:complete len:58 (-) comp32182_c0_seq11:857-1030(-)